MKKFILIAFVSILMFSCKKEISPVSQKTSYLSNVIASLKDSLSDNDYSNIDISNSIITKTESKKYFLRVPFKGTKLSEEFILLYTDTIGNFLKSSIIKLSKSLDTIDLPLTYKGTIEMSFLSRKPYMFSGIEDGYITAFHPHMAMRMMYVQPSAPQPEVLPEVIVTGYRQSGGGYYLYNSINLGSLFGMSFTGTYGSNNSGYYSSINGTNEGKGGGGGGGSYNNDNQHEEYFDQQHSTHGRTNDIEEDNPNLVDFEFLENLSPIDITKFLKCFSNIPDDGSTCSIEIFTDIPVDRDPNKLFNWQTASPGHTFLQIKKTNGSQSVMQNIGFYPVTGWKTLLTTAPVDGKFVDNSEHEFNAGLKMNLTPEQLKKTLDEMVYLSSFIKYDIDEFNCTDFALNVFNASRISNPLEIPKYDVPGGTAINGTNTPQGLFNKLKSMQVSGIEAENVTIPGFKGFVADSNGPCN